MCWPPLDILHCYFSGGRIQWSRYLPNKYVYVIQCKKKSSINFFDTVAIVNDMTLPLAKLLIISPKLFMIIRPHDIPLQCVKKRVYFSVALPFNFYLSIHVLWLLLKKYTLASIHLFLPCNTAVCPASRLISQKFSI